MHNHDDLAHQLAQHLQNECRMVWENIPAGCMGSCRPDVYTIEKSFSSPNPITYEIKVSLSDFRSDVTKGKWQSYLAFSYGVVFVVPKGLITKKDVPKQCGLITYNGDGIWHTVKKPILNPCKIHSDILLKLLMGGAERMTQAKPIQPREFDQWKSMDTLRKKWGKNIAEKLRFIEEYPKMKKELTALKKDFSEILGISMDRWNFVDSAKFKIDEIKKQADETQRKKQIADELTNMQRRLISDVDHVIRRYTA